MATRGAVTDPATAGPGEFELIDTYFARLGRGRPDVVIGIGDDAAVLRTGAPCGSPTEAAAVLLSATITCPAPRDPDHSGTAVSAALEACADALAAAGAAPRWLTLALTLSRSDPGWLAAFSRALADAAAPQRIELVGGDTTRGPGAFTLSLHGMRCERAASGGGQA